MTLNLIKNIFYSYLIILILFLFNSKIYSQPKISYATKIDTPPTIDGFVNDDVWQKAIPITDFLQQEPVPGAQPTQKTEVRILYDDQNLYLGVMCYDTEPEKIVARELKWDGFISGDDNFKVLFDTFNDNKSAYWFGTNPLGTQNDILFSGSGGYEGLNEDWNTVWEVRAQILDNGWSIEEVIPFSSLKFYNDSNQVWGVNFLRGIARNNEQDLWSSVGANKGFFKISEMGELHGLKNIKRGDPVYLIPYGTVGAEITPDNKKYVHEPGFDLKYGITETLSLDATINTDFAQVESDRAQINLSRFPLFFPEKREFFLEGAKTFSFSFGNSDNVFYSRRIGLSKGEEIPIIAGAKLVGRVDKYELGVLNMQTAAKASEPTTNYSAARVKYDLLDQSYVGFIATNKVSKDGFNNVIGSDAEFNFNDFLGDKNLIIGTRLAKSFEKKEDKNSFGGLFYVDYPNDEIDQFLSYKFLQANFNPEVGFLRRRGIQEVNYSFYYSPRINWNGIKRLSFSPLDIDLVYDSQKELSTANFTYRLLGFETNEGDAFHMVIERDFDKLEQDFTIFDTTVIRSNKYWFTSYTAEISTAQTRNLSGTMIAGKGNYYGGNRFYFYSSINATPNKHLTISGDFTHNNISINNNEFATNEFGARIRYDFSNKVNFTTFGQWNNEFNTAILNYRFNWRPKIGSDFYLVINQTLSTDGKIHTTNFTVLAKLVWLFVL